MNKKVKRVYPPGWTIVKFTSELLPGLYFPAPLPEPTESQKATGWIPKCANCSDWHFLIAHTLDGPVSAPCPVCRADKLKNLLETASGLMGMELDGKIALDVIEDFTTPSQIPGLSNAWELAARISDAADPLQWALFSGGYGSGKTHLLVALVNDQRLAGIWARYTSTVAILNELKESFDSDVAGITGAILRKYAELPFLAVDELDRINLTEWAGEQIFYIFNERYKHGLPTIFSSNLGPSALSEKGEELAALVSRITGIGDIQAITTEDLRPQQMELAK